jgi:hypothetical protein
LQVAENALHLFLFTPLDPAASLASEARKEDSGPKTRENSQRNKGEKHLVKRHVHGSETSESGRQHNNQKHHGQHPRCVKSGG